MKVLSSYSPERRPLNCSRHRAGPGLSTTALTIMAATIWFLTLVTPQIGAAEPSTTIGEVSGSARSEGQKPQPQPCPGCDADELVSKCSRGFAGDEWRIGLRVPYGVGAAPRMDVSDINRARRSIRKSMRSFDDSMRRMNDSINKIRNIRR